ncbi:MAG: helix-turn-helix domain-containing protein [Pseudomonadota bacterium]
MSLAPQHSLTAALARIRASEVATPFSQRLLSGQAALADQLREAVIDQVPAFSQSRNPEIPAELTVHCAEHVAEMSRLIQGGDVDSFAFVAQNARRRAEQHFPLEAILHAYRCGQRVFTRFFRELAGDGPKAPQALDAIIDLTLDYTDAISTVCTNAYVGQVRLMADLESDRRGQLLDMVLHGYDESDGRANRALGDAGYLDRRRVFCVVVARSVDPAEMLNPHRARRLAKALDDAFADQPTHRLVDLRDNQVVAVLSSIHRVSGWTMPAESASARAAQTLTTLGNAVLVGLSPDLHHTARIPNGFRQARIALELAGVDQRVVRFEALSLRQMALKYAADELRPVLPEWVAAFLKRDDESGLVLSDTLKAYADVSMNILKAAAVLSVHPNTVYSRLERIKDASGLEPRSFHQLNELLIACDCR